jgi:hypothetical protein
VFTGEYHQVGDLVCAEIAGPPVRMGRLLVGTVGVDGTIDCATRRACKTARIETTYHRRPRQESLVRLTPVEFETLLDPAHAA